MGDARDGEHHNAATLVVLAGLPGVGKTSIARRLARLVGATFVRIDSIELALRDAGQAMETMDDRGYRVAYAVARDNLRAGLTVIGDSVNPWPETRDAWRQVAIETGARLLDVEVVCSDRVEHRRRVEERLGGVPELSGPTWAEVEARDYRPWSRDHMILDTARLTMDEGVEAIWRALVENSGTRR